MAEHTARERVLKNIRAAALQKSEPYPEPTDNESRVFHQPVGPLKKAFAQRFAESFGHLHSADSPHLFIDRLLAIINGRPWHSTIAPLSAQLHKLGAPLTSQRTAEVSLTHCNALVARTGSIIIDSSANEGRVSSIYAPVHIVIAYHNQLIVDLSDYFSSLNPAAMPSSATIIGGPSRTADIEKTLVLGAHGPKELHLFILDNGFFFR